jgi:hypothetical protein
VQVRHQHQEEERHRDLADALLGHVHRIAGERLDEADVRRVLTLGDHPGMRDVAVEHQ